MFVVRRRQAPECGKILDWGDGVRAHELGTANGRERVRNELPAYGERELDDAPPELGMSGFVSSLAFERLSISSLMNDILSRSVTRSL